MTTRTNSLTPLLKQTREQSSSQLKSTFAFRYIHIQERKKGKWCISILIPTTSIQREKEECEHEHASAICHPKKKRREHDPRNPERDSTIPALEFTSLEHDSKDPQHGGNVLSHTAKSARRSAHGAQSARELWVFFLNLTVSLVSSTHRS
jgi:hypothetical protein